MTGHRVSKSERGEGPYVRRFSRIDRAVHLMVVVSFYALIHLPREEHRPLLERVAQWLRPDGHLLATLASSGHPGYTNPDFFGANMYWSHFEPSWYSSALRELGFKILEEGVLGHGYGDDLNRPQERHRSVFARLER